MTNAVAAPAPTRAEEWANVLTHGTGLVLSIAGLVVLILFALGGGVEHRIGFGVFGGTLVLMYAASTCFHAFRAPRLKHWLRIVDHIAIYFLIAGTYTPFALLCFDGGWGLWLLGIQWGIALTGMVFKLFFTGRFDALSVAIYLAMGWLGVTVIRPLLDAAPLGCLLWIGAGGLFYTVGVIFYAWRRLPYNHAIWHLFVLGGSVCHYLAVVLYLLP